MGGVLQGDKVVDSRALIVQVFKPRLLTNQEGGPIVRRPGTNAKIIRRQLPWLSLALERALPL